MSPAKGTIRPSCNTARNYERSLLTLLHLEEEQGPVASMDMDQSFQPEITLVTPSCIVLRELVASLVQSVASEVNKRLHERRTRRQLSFAIAIDQMEW